MDEEELNELEKIALEHISLAKTEKDLGDHYYKTISLEYKRAKIRKISVIKSLEINENRKSLAKKFRNLVIKKREILEEGTISFPKPAIETEENFANYYDLLADIQIQIGDIQNQINELELEIIKDRFKIAYEVNNAAKERNNLGNIQLVFINAVKANKPLKKQNKLRDKYLSLEETLIQDRKDVIDDMILLEKSENLFADLHKKLADKLSEREKIRFN